ncbi:MAG: 2-dehydropantoate 2-reductase [Rhodospirillales bacterium]|nr:2-dehydropantoate 2-reductase [Rhodospirillales bacterium]
MKVCIFGSGAIGGFLGARLARAGAEVGLIARGGQLDAIRRNGLRLISGDDDFVVRPPATDDPSDFGIQDAVIITLKAHSVPGCVAAMQPLLGPETMVVTAVNGIPYWYFHGHGGPFEGRVLESIDPGAQQWRGLGPERAVGCIVYPATDVIAPGVIQHTYGDKFPLGEPRGETTPRVRALSALLESAGLRAPVLDRIRDEIWLKLWGNLSFNPISVLTHATLGEIVADPQTRQLARTMMLEAQGVGERLGVRFRVDVERRIDGAGAVGAHKTSTLQDLERGRPMEIDALVTVVQELGRLVDLPTPTLDTVLALVQQRARIAGLYQ